MYSSTVFFTNEIKYLYCNYCSLPAAVIRLIFITFFLIAGNNIQYFRYNTSLKGQCYEFFHYPYTLNTAWIRYKAVSQYMFGTPEHRSAFAARTFPTVITTAMVQDWN
jgi:hypothetical protein